MNGLATCTSLSCRLIQCVAAGASRSGVSSDSTIGPAITGSSDAERTSMVRSRHMACTSALPISTRKNTSAHQMAEEQHDRCRRRRHDGRDRPALAPVQPSGGEQHRQPAADLPVQEAQQKAAVVGDEPRRQRPERAPPEQRAVQREHAGEVQQQDTAQQAASGDMDGQQAQQQRAEHIAGQVRNDRPVRRKHRPEHGSSGPAASSTNRARWLG